MGCRIGTTGQLLLSFWEEHLSKTCTIQFCKFMFSDQSDLASDYEVDKSLNSSMHLAIVFILADCNSSVEWVCVTMSSYL